MSNTVSQIVNAWNSGDISAIASLYAQDAVMHHPLQPQPLTGREAIRQLESGMFAAFSDIDWSATSVVGTGEALALEFKVCATNSKPMPTPKGPIPATNRRIELKGVSLIKLNKKGEIAEERRYFDSSSLFAQLGLGG